MTFTPVTTNALDGLSLPVDPELAGTVFFAVCFVSTGAIALRRRKAALSIAAALGVIQVFLSPGAVTVLPATSRWWVSDRTLWGVPILR